jgi:hypothetical protein
MDILHILVEIAKLMAVDGHNTKRGAPFDAPRFAAIIQCLVRPMRSLVMTFPYHSPSGFGGSHSLWI